MRSLSSLLILVCFGAAAQQAEPIRFPEKTYDFGEITEEGGHADHDFLFTNNSGRVIRILSVQASCGCTTPDWSKDAIQPGKTGFIKASFDPKGRPGYFNKSLTVMTDFDGNPMALQIKGQVVIKKTEITSTDFPAQNGNLRFKFNALNLGKIFINKGPSLASFQVYNSGERAVNFTEIVIGPAYIRIETPKVLAPRETGILKVIYDAKARNQYGFVSDNVEINTDDEAQPVKSFSVYATIEEFFPPLSANELTTAPVLRIGQSTLDLGRMRQGNVLEREIAIKNLGKKELQIRAVQGNCTCVAAAIEPVKIRAGGEARLKVSLSTQGRSGLQQKAVTIYSNDPRNPVQRITLTGYIENQ